MFEERKRKIDDIMAIYEKENSKTQGIRPNIKKDNKIDIAAFQ